MKRDKNYKMSKSLKTLLALMPFKNQTDRNVFKNIMIDAELVSKSQPSRKE